MDRSNNSFERSFDNKLDRELQEQRHGRNIEYRNGNCIVYLFILNNKLKFIKMKIAEIMKDKEIMI